MAEVLNVQKMQEVRNFVGKNGVFYVLNLATKSERNYFEGYIYNNGIVDSKFLSRITNSALPH